MKIELHEIRSGDVVEGYVDNDEEGVFGYGGKLNIRPKYQREFIYDDDKRQAVIDTVLKGFPLNVMYWVKNEDGTYELLDGQQRTISICQYVNNIFSYRDKLFYSRTQTEQNKILDYKLFIYFCEGNDEERLQWFRTINIAGIKLTEQELRNANYVGPWLTNAKKYFSKTGCPAYKISQNYCKAIVNRQELLELALKWYCNFKKIDKIESYMTAHQFDENADELWLYFSSVIEWVKTKFKVYRREMLGQNWGEMYNEYYNLTLDADKLESEIKKLMVDEEVQNKRGIYMYVLSGKTKYLNLREFDNNIKRQVYERQEGVCPVCKREGRKKFVYALEEMEADHIVPWVEGGKTILENCQLLCRDHNRQKTDK